VLACRLFTACPPDDDPLPRGLDDNACDIKRFGAGTGVVGSAAIVQIAVVL
jgi:hypothetical protein